MLIQGFDSIPCFDIMLQFVVSYKDKDDKPEKIERNFIDVQNQDISGSRYVTAVINGIKIRELPSQYGYKQYAHQRNVVHKGIVEDVSSKISSMYSQIIQFMGHK